MSKGRLAQTVIKESAKKKHWPCGTHQGKKPTRPSELMVWTDGQRDGAGDKSPLKGNGTREAMKQTQERGTRGENRHGPVFGKSEGILGGKRIWNQRRGRWKSQGLKRLFCPHRGPPLKKKLQTVEKKWVSPRVGGGGQREE